MENGVRRQASLAELIGLCACLVRIEIDPAAVRMLGPTGLFGVTYLIAALALGAGFIALSLVLLANPSRQAARRLYLSSLAYLALLFVAMALDRAL